MYANTRAYFVQIINIFYHLLIVHKIYIYKVKFHRRTGHETPQGE